MNTGVEDVGVSKRQWKQHIKLEAWSVTINSKEHSYYTEKYDGFHKQAKCLHWNDILNFSLNRLHVPGIPSGCHVRRANGNTEYQKFYREHTSFN